MQAVKESQATKQQEEVEVDEIPSYSEIDSLQEHGINMSDIKKLKEAGINTIGSVVMMTSKVHSQLRC